MGLIKDLQMSEELTLMYPIISNKKKRPFNRKSKIGIGKMERGWKNESIFLTFFIFSEIENWFIAKPVWVQLTLCLCASSC